MNADQHDAQTAIDGLALTPKPVYEIVVSSNGIERYRSQPAPIEFASKQMAKIIAVQTSAMGYQQDPTATDSVTLKRGSLKLHIQMVEVQ